MALTDNIEARQKRGTGGLAHQAHGILKGNEDHPALGFHPLAH